MKKKNQDERPCDCGDCRSCRAWLLSDDDTQFMSADDFWRSEQEPDDYGALDDYDDCSGDS